MSLSAYYENQKNEKLHDLFLTEKNPVSATTGAILDPLRIMQMVNKGLQNPRARENFEKVCSILGKQPVIHNGRLCTRKLVIAELARKAAVSSQMSKHYETQGKLAAERVERQKRLLAHGK